MKMFPGAVAQIEWSENKLGAIDEVSVFDRDAITERQREQNARRFENSHGACILGWMDGTDARSTPEGLFGYWLLSKGFANDEAALQALDQIGQIEEAQWARTMARSMRDHLAVVGSEAHGEYARPDHLQPVAYEPRPAGGYIADIWAGQ